MFVATPDHHARSVNDVFKTLGSRRSGLTGAEAGNRLKKFGTNELPDPPSISSLKILIRQIASPLIFLLLIAVSVSFFLGNNGDAILIAATIVVTVAFGYFQEAKAEQSLAALRKAIKSEAKVIRDGKEVVIPTPLVVPGDIVVFFVGDRLSADLRLIEATGLSSDEALLSGESMPNEKQIKPLDRSTPLAERSNMVYAGTTIVSGEGEGVVVATGKATEVGKIAGALRDIRDESSQLTIRIRRMAITISIAIVIAGLLTFGIGVWRGVPLLEMLILMVAAIVAAIPEGLAVSVTVIMVIGMLKLHKAKALVRRLSSAETLGSVSVICLDKTGTLTEGKMSLVEIVGNKKRAVDLIVSGVSAKVANIHEPESAWRVFGEGTESALLAGAIKDGGGKGYRERKILQDLPFSSENGYRATLTEHNGEYRLTVIGQPELLLDSAKKISAGKVYDWLDNVSRLAGSGIRVLGIATKQIPTPIDLTDGKKVLSSLEFVALAALADPMRANVKDTIGRIRAAGIRTVMITGDNPATASAIARAAGLIKEGEEAIAWSEIDKMPPGEFVSALQRYQVFARVPPSEKLKIVSALQDAGETVAMTGDGVNDAPALKRASIGVVMGSGTDVAKEAGDLILLDDNLETIVMAISGGRRIFDNIRKVVLYLMYPSFQEIFLIGVTIMMGWPLPILPAQILWVNLVGDTLPAFSLAFEPQESRAMFEPPRPRNEGILDKSAKIFLVFFGLLSSAILICFVAWLFSVEPDIAHIRTMTFMALGLGSLFVIFSLRRMRTSILSSNPFHNRWLLGAVAIGLLLYLTAIYLPPLADLFGNTPLGVLDWTILLCLGLIQVVIVDLIKRMLSSKKNKNVRALSAKK